MPNGDFQSDLFAGDSLVPPPASTPNFASRRPLRILIADDSPINRNVIRTVLERLGYEPEEAANGGEVLDRHGDGAFDYVFMDIDMPGMTGIEAASAIRNAESYAKTADPSSLPVEIVAVTANPDPNIRECCRNAGMNDFLPKPVEPDDIEAQLKKSWRRINARRQRAKSRTG